MNRERLLDMLADLVSSLGLSLGDLERSGPFWMYGMLIWIVALILISKTSYTWTFPLAELNR